MFIEGLKGWLVGTLIILGCGGGAIIIGAIIGDKIDEWIRSKNDD